jgi:hypothetical protein
MDVEAFYGGAIEAPEAFGDSDIQDDGLFFRATVRAF